MGISLDIAERKQVEQALKKKGQTERRVVRETALIVEIGRIISSSLHIEEVYERFVEELRKILHFDRATVNLVDFEKYIGTVPYAAGISVPGRQPGQIFPLAGTATELSVKTRKGVILQLENENEIANQFPGLLPVFKAGLRSSMAVPLISKDQPIGVLHFASRKPNAYTDTDLNLAESIGAQIAGAIANAQLYRELKQAEQTLKKSEEESRRLAHENAIVAEIGRIISATLNIDDVYERFAAEARKLIPFDRISMSLLDSQKDTITVAHIEGVDVDGRQVPDTYPLHGSASEIVMHTCSSLIIHPESKEDLESRFPRFLPHFQAGLRSMMLVPLISGDKVFGILHFQSKKEKAYTDQDRTLAQNIAAQIAGAMANAQLFLEQRRDKETLSKAYVELERAQAQLIQAEKAEVIGRLASGVAHEVKNPLLIINQGVDYLSAHVRLDNENVPMTLKYIKDAVKRADSVVKGLLNFSRIEEVKKSPGNLNSIIESSLVLVKALLDINHIEVIKELEKDILSLNLDKSRMEQAFLNLFINAIDAMPGGGQLKIRTYNQQLTEVSEGVGAGREIFKPGETAVIAEIEDTGTEIPADIMDKIFDPFFTTKRDKGGTGLGLPIVRNIVEMHNGEIKVENKKDKSGVRVVLRFKARKTEG